MTPQPVGYSGKPLWQKLGLAADQRLLLVTPPPMVFYWLSVMAPLLLLTEPVTSVL